MPKTFLPLLLVALPGCLASGGGDGSGDADADSDVDSDADTDTGTGTGTGTDTGTGSGTSDVLLFETSMGDFEVDLDATNAPVTTENFLEYVDAGFYADTVFHRLRDDFMIQGGGFDLAHTQKPTNPAINLEISPALRHVDGAIAMARTNDPNSATSQFYVCDGPQPALDDQYAVFGVTVSGIDVVRAIAAVPTDADWWPIDDVVLEAVTRQ